jgi:hypothetical protein
MAVVFGIRNNTYGSFLFSVKIVNQAFSCRTPYFLSISNMTVEQAKNTRVLMHYVIICS